MRKEKVLFELDPDFKCEVSFYSILSFLIVVFILCWVEYFFYDLFKGYTTLKHFNSVSILGLVGYVILFCYINLFFLLSFVKVISNFALYDSYFEICVLFKSKKVYYSSIEKIILRRAIGGRFFEFLYISNGKKYYYVFLFSINEELKGKNAEYVIQNFKKIFEEKGIPVIVK